VQAFHTTGQFTDADDLTGRLLQWLAEIAADDEAPWVKIGDVLMRASRSRDGGTAIVLSAQVRDPGIVHAIEGMRPDEFHRGQPVPIVTARRAGDGRVTAVITETQAASVHEVELTADVAWADSHPNSMEASFSGLSPDDQTEIGLRAGLLGEPLPAQLDRNFGSMIDTHDPLAELDGLGLPQSAEEPVAQLLVVERRLGRGRASRLTHLALGPPHFGERRIEVEYAEPQRYANDAPRTRRIEGTRRAG
jgi:hypothetical protein